MATFLTTLLILTVVAWTIIGKYTRAVENHRESKAYFEELSEPANDGLLRKWEEEIQRAERDHVTKPQAMDIMAAKIPKGRSILDCDILSSHGFAAPTLAAKRLELLATDERGISGEISWVMASFKIEEQK